MQREKIDTTPDTSLFIKLGSANYSVAEAISELIDNSIDAREDHVTVNINITKDKVTVEDDGVGMNKTTAINSVILGRSSKQEGALGHFGMGLKTSCMSLGKVFTIRTTMKDTKEGYQIDFDSEEWSKHGTWDQEIKITEDSDIKLSGTRIEITRLKFNHHQNLIKSLGDHLAERFGVFIAHGEATIRLNGVKLKASKEDVLKDTVKKFEITLSNGKKVTGWTGLLEKGSQEKSGFNLYRFKRLIRAHSKLGYQYHPSKMWVTGEIHLDPIPVTHNKREFIETDELFAEFFEQFMEILKEVISLSQNRHKDEKIKDLPKHIKETFKDNLVKALNNFDELKELSLPKADQLKKDPEGEDHDAEKRDIAGDIIEKDKKENDTNNPRTPNKTSANTAKYIRINGQKYKFEFDWANLEDADKAKTSYLDPSENKIMVLLNTKYKLLDIVKPDLMYVIFYVSEGLVEVFLNENAQSMDRLVSLRDGIIKRLADVYADDLEIQIREKDQGEVNAYGYLVTDRAEKEEDTKSVLTAREKEILSLRIEKGLKLQEIGTRFTITRERVRQIIAKAYKKIEKADSKTELDPQKIEVIQGREVVSTEEEAIEIQKIMNKVAQSHEVTIDDLLMHSRKHEFVVPRHIAMYSLRTNLKLSFPKIAKLFDRDHTTVIHAYNKVKMMLEEKE